MTTPTPSEVLAERLEAMLHQVGHPDYSLGEFYEGVKLIVWELRQVRAGPPEGMVLVSKRVLDAAWALSAFIKHHDYPTIGSSDFNELTRLADAQDTALRLAAASQGGVVELDYEAISRRAMEQAKQQAALMYPPGPERDKKQKELEMLYYRQMASHH